MSSPRSPRQLDRLCGMVQHFVAASGAQVVVTPDTRLADLGVDSLNLVRFVVGIESAFAFEFDDDEIDFHSFPTMNELAEYVVRKTETGAVA